MRHVSDPKMIFFKIGGKEPAPTHLLVQPADLFLHLLSLCGHFLSGLDPYRQNGVKECREHESTAWAGPPPLSAGRAPSFVSRQAKSKGRGSSGVRMMGNPNSQAGFKAL